MKVIFSQAKMPRVGDMSNKTYTMWTPYEFDSWANNTILQLYPHLQEAFADHPDDMSEEEEKRIDALWKEYKILTLASILTVDADGVCVLVIGEHRISLDNQYFQGMQAMGVGPKQNFGVVFHIFNGKITIPEGMCLGLRSHGMADIADLTGDTARFKKYIQKRNLLAWP